MGRSARWGGSGRSHEQALGRALLRAQRARVWEAVGLATLFEYAERFVGLRPRQTEERLRVAALLEELPVMDAAFGEGVVCYSAVRELSRVADAQTEGAWIEVARGKTVGEIAGLVSGREPGDLPTDPEREGARRHRLVIEVSADTYATYREAQARLRRESDASLSEEDGLLLMARAVLGGPEDAGRSSYQVRMTQCATCLATEQEGRGAAITVEPAVAEMAACDGQRYEGTGAATQSIPPSVRRFVVSRQHGRCGVPGCSIAVYTDVHHVTFRSDGGTHDPEGLILICSAHHRALHRGMLRIEGTWSTGLRFAHADGRPYGFMDRPRRQPTGTPCPHRGVSA